MAEKLVKVCDICGDVVYPSEEFGDLRAEKVQIRLPGFGAAGDLDEKCAERLWNFFAENAAFPITVHLREPSNS
ncbi:hypothetical protein [Lentzea sp. E54]|uniref:hypothetical protein n=1 Tax=Lentzea xerophila TaxID=3435883 RepID=UPI003DA563E3